MKILTMKKQNDAYKKLINIILELRKSDTVEATDAISDAFDLAYIVGGDAMLEAMAPSKVKVHNAAEQIADMLSRSVERFDEITDRIGVSAE